MCVKYLIIPETDWLHIFATVIIQNELIGVIIGHILIFVK